MTESDPPNEIMESSGWKGNFYGVPGTDMSAVPLSMEQVSRSASLWVNAPLGMRGSSGRMRWPERDIMLFAFV